MFQRIVGVFRLSAATFEEIEHDLSATSQAAILVGLVGVMVGLGNGFASIFGTPRFFNNFVGTLLGAYLGWLLWSIVSYFVGTNVFKGQADLGEMLRVIGFATAPLMLGIIPFLGGIVGSLWAMAAGYVAVRQGLDLDNVRALLTVVLGFVLYFFVVTLLGLFSPFV